VDEIFCGKKEEEGRGVKDWTKTDFLSVWDLLLSFDLRDGK
jgi:hypothetical protein